jgi:hypothetical protein
MNEADIPNNGASVEPLESVNSPQPELGSCPFYSVVPDENTAIKKVPLLAPAEDKQCTAESSPENVPQEDWVAEPDREKQVAIDSEFKQLLTLNEELQSANNDLYAQVEQLKVALAESEKALQWQKTRSSVTESMFNQQTQELSAAQEQIQSLYQQLEAAVQTVQHQEISLDNYKAQLEINQQRLAQLERECALVQSNYQEQSHQLLQSENACRELRTRLMRQQRQTLQFKAALEKCLETPFPNDASWDANQNNLLNNAIKKHKQANSLSFNAQPIRPWSVEDDIDNVKEESFSPAVPEQNDNSAPTQLFVWNNSEQEDILAPEQPANTPEIISDCPSTLETVLETVSPLESSNLEEQLDSVIQSFFTSESTSASPQPLPQDVESNDADEPVWETFAMPSSEHQELENTTITLIEETDDITQDYWLQPSQLPPLAESFNDGSNNANSPAPIVYPQRPPKGRKSLASVELPNFRTNS